MPRYRIHEPIFPQNQAVYIIWCDEWQGDWYTLAARHLTAMLAAWDAMADYSPRDTFHRQPLH